MKLLDIKQINEQDDYSDYEEGFAEYKDEVQWMVPGSDLEELGIEYHSINFIINMGMKFGWAEEETANELEAVSNGTSERFRLTPNKVAVAKTQ